MTSNGNGSSDFNAHERAVVTYSALAMGAEMTTSEIATMIGVSWQGAAKMMDGISRVAPIVRDDGSGRWRLFNNT